MEDGADMVFDKLGEGYDGNMANAQTFVAQSVAE
jgi:hypothetical protein